MFSANWTHTPIVSIVTVLVSPNNPWSLYAPSKNRSHLFIPAVLNNKSFIYPFQLLGHMYTVMGCFIFILFFLFLFFIFHFISETKQWSKTKIRGKTALIWKEVMSNLIEIHWGVFGETHFTTFIISNLTNQQLWALPTISSSLVERSLHSKYDACWQSKP